MLRGSACAIEPLETRTLLASVAPTNLEQYLVELVNRARANPVAEARRQGVDLNEGLAPGTITTAWKQPLAINFQMSAAARGHVKLMYHTGVFAHAVPGEPGLRDRLQAVGYSTDADLGEAMALVMPSKTKPQTADSQEWAYIVDPGIKGRPHRRNLLNGVFREIGISEIYGDFTGGWPHGPAALVTEDFAAGNTPFLTGVAYNDAVVHDHFYTPGEGLANVTVTAVSQSTHKIYTTRTFATGGYTLALPAGTYRVTATGGGLGGTVVYPTVTLLGSNLKRDFTPAMITQPASAQVVSASAADVVLAPRTFSSQAIKRDDSPAVWG